jgi:hypothetical protein
MLFSESHIQKNCFIACTEDVIESGNCSCQNELLNKDVPIANYNELKGNFYSLKEGSKSVKSKSLK